MKQLFCLALGLAITGVAGRAQDYGTPAPSGDPVPTEAPLSGMPPTAGVVPGPALPLAPAYTGMSGDDLFAEILEHERNSQSRLHDYSSVRTYSVVNDKGRVSAQEVVRMDYHAPDRKTFAPKSGSGSGLIRDLVLERLIQSEKEAAAGRPHRDSAMSSDNYRLELMAEQDVGPYHCLVAEAIPKRRDRYLFEGKIWVNTDDYGIVRMAGKPARPLSFWLTRAEFVRQYQKVGDFWFPAEDETLAQMRFYGKKTLIVKYADYQVNAAATAPASTSIPPGP